MALRGVAQVKLSARRIVAGSLTLVGVVLLLWAWRGRLLERMVEAALSREIGYRVVIGDLDIKLPRRFELHDLAVYPEAGSSPMLKVAEVELELESLVRGAVRSIRARDAHLVATESEDGFDLLRRAPPAAAPGGAMPSLVIQGGSLELQGSGPVMRKLEQVLAPSVPRRLDLLSLESFPGATPGSFTAHGIWQAFGLLRWEMEGAGERHDQSWLKLKTVDPHADLADPDLRAVLAPALLRWLDDNRVAGRTSAAVTMLAHPTGLGAAAVVELVDVELTPVVFPVPLSHGHGTLLWNEGRFDLVRIAAQYQQALLNLSGSVEGGLGAPRADLRLSVHHGSFDSQLLDALARQPEIADLLTAFEPSGGFHDDVRIESGPGGIKAWHEVTLLDAAMTYHGILDQRSGRRRGFPLPIERIHGTVSLHPDRVEFAQVLGRTRTGARVVGSGQFTIRGPHIFGDLWIQASEVELDDAFRDAAVEMGGEEVAEVFRRLGLQGTVDLDVHYRLEEGAPTGDWNIEVRPRRLTLRPQGFPMAFRLDAGRLVLTRREVRLSAVRGLHAPDASPAPAGDPAVPRPPFNAGLFEVDGDFSFPEGSGQLELRGQEVELGPALREALATLEGGRIERIWAELDPTGMVDLRARWRRSREAGSHLEITLLPQGVDLKPARTGLPILGLTGAVTCEIPERGPFTFRVARDPGLQAGFLGGRLRIDGHLDDLGQGTLYVSAERMLLRGRRDTSDPGSDVVSALRSVSEEAAVLLETLRPRGRVRARCELACEVGRLRVQRLEVGPDFPSQLIARPQDEEVGPDSSSPASRQEGVEFLVPQLQSRVRWSGGMVVGLPGSGEWSFDDLKGSLAEADLALSQGHIRFDEQGLAIQCVGTLGAVPLKTLLEALLPESYAPGLGALEIEGTTYAELKQVLIHVPAGATMPDHVVVDVDADLSRCGLGSGKGIQDLNGRVLMYLESQGGGVPQIQGRLHGASMRLGELDLHGIRADLQVAEGALQVTQLQGEFAGGRLPPALNYWRFPLSGLEPYEGALRVETLQLERLFGVGNPRTRGWEGTLVTDLRFKGQGWSVGNLEAAGTVNVSNGQLWSIPVFDQLYELGISRILGRKERPRFESGEVDLRLHRGVIYLTDLRLDGPSLSISGRGALGASGLNVHLIPKVGVDIPFVDIPILGDIALWIVSLVERETLSFRFEGSYSNPRVRWDPVSARAREDMDVGLDRPRLAELRPLIPAERF